MLLNRSLLNQALTRSAPYFAPVAGGDFLLDDPAFAAGSPIFVGGFQRHRTGFTGDCAVVSDVTGTITQGIGLGGDDRIDRAALLSFAAANGGDAFLADGGITNQVDGGTVTWSPGPSGARPQIVSANTVIENSSGNVAVNFNNDSSLTTPALSITPVGGYLSCIAIELPSTINFNDTILSIIGNSNPVVRGGGAVYDINNVVSGTALDIAHPGINVPHVLCLGLMNGVEARSAILDSIGVTELVAATGNSQTSITSIDILVSTRFFNGLQYNWAFFSDAFTNQQADEIAAFLL